MNNAALQSKPDYALNIVQGPDKGISYKLLGSVITLGRAPENDIVLADAKASRSHARIEKRGDDYWAVNTSAHGDFAVNGMKTAEKKLIPGDKIVFGQSTIIFGLPAPVLNKAPSLKLMRSSSETPRHQRHNLNNNQPTNKKILPIFVIAFAVVATVFLFKNETIKRKIYNVNDETAMDETIEDLNKKNETTQNEIYQKGKHTQQYGEAQSFYLQGFREFREGNFSRAIQNFQTALTLYPDHPLAKRYLSRSQMKLNEEITGSLERGEKDFQTERYMSAFNEYRTVILLTNDLNNKNVQLAQKRIEAIKLILMNNR